MNWLGVVLLGVAILCFAAVAISYGGLLPILRRLRDAPTPVLDGPVPAATVVMTALNEGDQIEAKLQNLFEEIGQLEKPLSIDVLLIDDGSEDQTGVLAEQYPVRLVRNEERRGVARSLERALPLVTTEIVVLTDVGTLLAPSALSALLDPFRDDEVGTVTGVVRFAPRQDALADGFSRFWDYEIALRTEMSRVGALSAASGALMAFRLSDAPELPVAFAGDCFAPLASIRAGRRVIQAGDAVAIDPGTGSVRNERAARTRMVARNLSCIRYFCRGQLPVRKNLLVRATLFFHKTVRWYAGLLLAVAAIAFLGALWTISSAAAAGLGLIGLLGAALVMLVGPRLAERVPLLGTLSGFALVQFSFVRGIRDSFISSRHMVYEKSG